MLKVLDNPLYYLDNFHQALEWIGQRYGDLLTPEESAFIKHFPHLPQASRALFVRMLMRKGCLFRASKLTYAEIGDAQAAARPLLELGWIESDPELDLEQLFDLLQKQEVGAIFRLSAHEKNARKAEQLQALRAQYPGAFRFSTWYEDSGDHLYHVLGKPLCERLRLIFFGNLRQDWSEFVLSDLGVYKYEKVEFTLSSRGFRTRHDIDAYLALQRCRERFFEAPDEALQEVLQQVLQELAAGAPGNDWLASRREKLLFQIARHLEKYADWEGALRIYSACNYPGARVRAIRVLEKPATTARPWPASNAPGKRRKTRPNASICCASRRACGASWAMPGWPRRRPPAWRGSTSACRRPPSPSRAWCATIWRATTRPSTMSKTP
ncbi:hypothetical protein AAKU55_004727 [Oxalobacteraceae bacterium GrIS 1.11]